MSNYGNGIKTVVIILFLILFSTIWPNVFAKSSNNELSGHSSDIPKLVFGEYHTWYAVDYSAGRWSWRYGWNHWEWTGEGPQHNPNIILPDGKRDIASTYYPLIGPYDSGSEDVIEYHIQLAKASGIDAFLVDWYSGRNFGDFGWMESCAQKLLKVSEKVNFTVALEYEPRVHFKWIQHSTRSESLKAVEEDIAYIFQNYVGSRAYLHVKGKPVIFVFGAPVVRPDEWKQIFDNLRSKGLDAIYVGDIADPTYYKAFNCLYEWINIAEIKHRRITPAQRLDEVSNRLRQSLIHYGSEKFFAAGVWPGFNDTGVWAWGEEPKPRVLDRQNGKVYNETWSVALKYNVPWVIIMTFNDWNEGTNVEPSLEFGYQYLNATRYFSARLKKQEPNYSGIPVPKAIYDASQAIKQAEWEGRLFTLDEAKAKLQNAKEAFYSQRYSEALTSALQSTDIAKSSPGWPVIIVIVAALGVTFLYFLKIRKKSLKPKKL